MLDMLDRFEQVWQEGQPPDIASFLATSPIAANDASVRRQVLEELVKIDLEYRWQRAGAQASEASGASTAGVLPARPTIEHYLAVHPELAPDGEVAIDLVAEEYRIRRRRGDQPGLLSFAARFPYLADALVGRLAQVDDELGREQGAQAERESPGPDRDVVPPPLPTPRVQFTLTQGVFAGITCSFDERSTCIVGKADDCRLRFPRDDAHATISRHHCLFDISPPLVRVRDLGSRNGTYVNGVKIGRRDTVWPTKAAHAAPALEYDLKDGDEVQLGRVGVVVLRVQVEATLCCFTCGVAMESATAGAAAPAARRLLCARCQDGFVETVDSQACVRCGADVSGQVTGESGEFICASCQGRPSQILERMLEISRGGDAKTEGIQDYEIVRELGRGGMGAVFLARHPQSGEELALKVMLPQVALNQRMRQTFLREIENTRLLQHPNVVRLRDLGDSEGAFYFAMDYCAGGSVQNLLQTRGKPLPLDEAVDILRKALAGLDYAHNLEVPVSIASGGGGVGRAVGLVHRDLKPANLFLSQPTPPWQVKVGDYGMAKAFDAAGLSGLTWTGTACGTPYFMPRVQVVDFRFARPEVDVWALAACFYFMLCNSPPRDFKPKVDMWRTILETKPVPLAKRNPAIPARIAEFVDYALSEEPEIPFKSASQLRHALDKAL